VSYYYDFQSELTVVEAKRVAKAIKEKKEEEHSKKRY
jgi:hypothetical protein